MFGGRQGRMPSSMSHSFSQVPQANIPRSAFNRSNAYKTTFNAGYLIPIFLDEALPGDTFSLKMSSFARMATPIVPVMDNLYCDVFFFAVPNRLVWDNWERFNGAQDNPDDSTDFIIPQTVSPGIGGWPLGTLADYFGLPTGVYIEETVSCLPFRAYWLIWNEWFRDENLQDSADVSKGDGPDPAYTTGTPAKRGKRHDYFTSALPWPQKGPSVLLPLGDTAPVGGIGKQTTVYPTAGQVVYDATDIDSTVTYAASAKIDPAAANTSFYISEGAEGRPGVYVDLAEATAATINELRQAFQIQKLYERDARGGTRYTEIIRAHFGVTSPDARLQRPEYLGGGTTQINMSPIPQTDATVDGSTPMGTLAAMSVFSHSGVGFVKSFTEHCIVIGMMCVRADLTYQQGVDRMWSRRTRFDFYWPALSHLGEQPILNKEIFLGIDPVVNSAVFGYQERFAEYRYKPSKITGYFRSTSLSSLDVWHLSQEFSTTPPLNDEFIAEDPPINRVIATPGMPQFLFDAYFKLKCVRPMPTYSVPGLIDHF